MNADLMRIMSGIGFLGAGAKQHPDPGQRITLPAAVSAGGLLDPAAARIVFSGARA